MFQTGDTIAAISTPSGPGAIGVIRLSGPQALNIASKALGKDLEKEAGNTLHFGRFRVKDEVLDEVVAGMFKAPHSYTGEDVVELSFHGSSYILSSALAHVLDAGCRMAEAGEFTQRAFFNRKLDLSQAEAVTDLIASESKAEHALAMHQMRGGFSKEISRLREELIHFASLIELELDFSEEDVEFANRDELRALVEKIRAFVAKLMDSFRYGNAVKNGVPVAIIGKPNAGKSTLLNALLNEERALVSSIAGTTRDSIEDEVIIQGIRFRFIDTAGIRETLDTIEAMGVKRSLEKMKSAAIVLLIHDAAEPEAALKVTLEDLKASLANTEAHVISLANKSDLLNLENATADLAISAKTGAGLDALRTALVNTIESGKVSAGDVIVTNTRHLQALKATDESLERTLDGLTSGMSGDLVAMDIRQALHHLGSITGEITTDDLLGNIFSRFCIGK